MFDDDFEDFIRSHMNEIADKIGGSSGERMKKLTNQRQEVNRCALNIIEEKGDNLCASLLHEWAKENKTLAAIIDIGWTVNDFEGVASFFNRLSGKKVLEGDLTTAVMLRVFGLAVLSVGVQANTSDYALDDLISDIYNIELHIPDEDQWDNAHTTLTLEEAEGEIWWERVTEIVTKAKEEFDEQEDQDG